MAKIEISTHSFEQDGIDFLSWKGENAKDGKAYSGKAVREAAQKALGGKYGYLRWKFNESQSMYYLQAFNSETDAEAYDQDPTAYAGLLKQNLLLPISTVQGDSYIGQLASDKVSGSAYTVKTTGSMEVKARFYAVHVNGVLNTQETYNCVGTLHIQRSNDGQSWTEASSMQITGADKDATNFPVSINLMEALPSNAGAIIAGTYYVRAYVTFSYESDGEARTGTTSSIMYVVNAVNLTIKNLRSYTVPIDASNGVFDLSYQITGAVEKWLHVEITGRVGSENKIYTMTPEKMTASQNYPASSPWMKSIANNTAYGMLSHGVHTVRAWMSCDDGSGKVDSNGIPNGLESEKIISRFMVVNGSASQAELTAPYLMLQQTQNEATNYVQTVLASYAVWKADDATVPMKATSTPIDMAIVLSDYSESGTNFNAEYLRIEDSVLPGESKDIDATIEIEDSVTGESQTEYDAYLYILRKTAGNGGWVNWMQETVRNYDGALMQYQYIRVDNSNSYAPTPGADFFFNPKVRNNTESNWRRVLNSANGNAEVESTFHGMQGGTSDGFITSDVDGQKIFRLLAGQSLHIGYNPWSQFATQAQSAMSLEIDYMVRNVTNEEDPIISICETIAGTARILGLRMAPLKAFLMTALKTNEEEQDFRWQEEVRTHVVINLVPGINPMGMYESAHRNADDVANSKPLALCRIFINGYINREFDYDVTRQNQWCSNLGHGGIHIGQKGCDIDIYGIRCYKTTLTAQNIVNNYISSLPSAEEKARVRAINDVIGDDGTVSYSKVKNDRKRNCLVVHGGLPYKRNQSTVACYLEWCKYDDNGNLQKEYSGTLGKAAYLAYIENRLAEGESCLMMKPQGSTANTYYENNGQTKASDIAYMVTILMSLVHKDFGWKPAKSDFTDEKAAECPMYLDGVQIQGSSYSGLTDAEKERVQIEVPDGWFDLNGMYHGQAIRHAEGQALSVKDVFKINYASPMQTHKMGCCNIYNDVMKAVTGGMALHKANPEARFAVYEEPYYLFHQPTETDTPVFRGPCTWGSGKADKPTMGYNKKTMPLMAMFEGSYNNRALCDFRCPWDDKVVYNSGEEAFQMLDYTNGNYVNHFDFDMGATYDAETTDADGTKHAKDEPKKDIVDIFKRFVNFVYCHNSRLRYSTTKTRAEWLAEYEELDSITQEEYQQSPWYFTRGDNAYTVIRFDYTSGEWVDAGTWSDSQQKYLPGVRDLRTDSLTADAFKQWQNDGQGNYAELNKRLNAAIAAHARDNFGRYAHAVNHKTHYNLINYLFAGTDNCSKNTYFVIDPETSLIWMYQDDVDTIIATDNNGQQTKQWFIDRMHDQSDVEGGYKQKRDYEGIASTYFNLIEDMYETYSSDRELQSNMRDVLTAIANLVSPADKISGFDGSDQNSLYGAMCKYFWQYADYWPQNVMNETARIRYEFPASFGYVSTGSQARAIAPITQSLGDQQQSEKQYMKRRLVLAAQYAAWGEFGTKREGITGINDASGAFSLTHSIADPACAVNLKLKSKRFFWPTGSNGDSPVDPHVRVCPNETYGMSLGNISGDGSFTLYGMNYFTSIGNIGDIYASPYAQFSLQGKRLTEFVAEPTDGKVAPFHPGTIVVDATNLEKVSLKGCRGIPAGEFDLSKQIRLGTLDLRETNFTRVYLPSTQTLTDVALGENINILRVMSMPSLKKLSVDGIGNMDEATVSEVSNVILLVFLDILSKNYKIQN